MFHEVKSAETHSLGTTAEFLKTWADYLISARLNSHESKVTIRCYSQNFKRGELAKVLNTNTAGLPLVRSSVNKYLRGHYVLNHKGKSRRRGLGKMTNRIWWEKKLESVVPASVAPKVEVDVRVDDAAGYTYTVSFNEADASVTQTR